jgi:hypothetical protein
MGSGGGGVNTCTECGERRRSDSGRHICTVVDNRTGFHIGDPVLVGQAPGQIVQLQVVGDSGMARVYFRAQLRSDWYLTGQLERVAA